MMRLVHAEWMKIVGHRRAVFWMLGVFPTGALLFFLLSIPAAGRPAMLRIVESSLSNWTDMLLLSWLIPSHIFGRLFLLAFTAFVFASEYEWGTWKSIVPGQSRTRLVLAKFVNMTVLVIATFLLLSWILAAGGIAMTRLAGVEVRPPLTAHHLVGAMPEYFQAAVLAFLAFVITGTFAALGAIVTRTVLGGTLAGVGAAFADPALLFAPRLLARLLDAPVLMQLQRLAPFYNIDNARSWLTEARPTQLVAKSFVEQSLPPPQDGLLFSFVVLGAWVVLGVAATCWVFERQDLTD